jgi:hypothetical protein
LEFVLKEVKHENLHMLEQYKEELEEMQREIAEELRDVERKTRNYKGGQKNGLQGTIRTILS